MTLLPERKAEKPLAQEIEEGSNNFQSHLPEPDNVSSFAVQNGVENDAPDLSVSKQDIRKREKNNLAPRSRKRGFNQSKTTLDSGARLRCTPPLKGREETVNDIKKTKLENKRRFLAQVISVLFSVKKPTTLSYLSFLIGEWEEMTVDLKFLSKNSSLLVILPLDGDFIIELKYVPNSALKLSVYLQRLSLAALEVFLVERIDKLLDLLKKETVQRNVILDKIKSGPVPIETLLQICHGSTNIASVGVGFFLKHCEDFMVFKFYGVTYVSCRNVQYLTLALDSESVGSLNQQKDEEFIVGRIKFILSHQLTSISIDELQYLRMGHVTVDGNLLIKHADVLVRSNFTF